MAVEDGQRGGLLRRREGDDSGGGGVADGGEGGDEREPDVRTCAGTALAGAGSGVCSATGVARRKGVGAAAWARAGGRSHYNNRRKSGLSL